MKRFMNAVLLVCLLFMFGGGAMTVAGCQLYSDAAKQAEAVAQTREKEAADLKAAVEKARKVFDEIKAKYDAAVAAGDQSAIDRYGPLVIEAASNVESARVLYESGAAAFNAAVDDFKKAKGAAGYVGTVWGWLLALFGGGGVGGTAIGLAVKKVIGGKLNVATEAVTATTALIEKIKPAASHDPGFMAAVGAVNESTSEKAKLLIDELRP